MEIQKIKNCWEDEEMERRTCIKCLKVFSIYDIDIDPQTLVCDYCNIDMLIEEEEKR